MRKDVTVDEVWFDGPDDDYRRDAGAREREERLRVAEARLAQVEQERDYYLLLGRSWEQRWQREAEARLAAETELRRVKRTAE
jgi:hypothetical protein